MAKVGSDVRWPDPPLDRCILGFDPLDEFSVLIGDWISTLGEGQSNVEIEAKVGRIVDGISGRRIEMPVRTETVVEMQQGWRFESNLSQDQHSRINQLLNKALAESQERIKYKRVKEVDFFHTDEQDRGVGGRRPDKIRVTKDEATFRTTAIVCKRRLADLNIYCPQRQLDYRISVNVEEPRSVEPQGEPDFRREKNRLRYTHQEICIDLTNVTEGESRNQSNELEIEFADADAILRKARDCVHAQNRGEWTPYYDSIMIFLNNIRTLVRNVE